MDLLYIFTVSSHIIPFFLYLATRKKFSNQLTSRLLPYLLYITVHFSLVTYLRTLPDKSAFCYALRLFNVIELWLFVYFFIPFIKHTFTRKFIKTVAILFTFYCIYDFYISKMPSVGFYPAAIECICLMLFIIIYFYERFQNLSMKPLTHTKIFWISFGFFVYATGSFFLFLYSQGSMNNNNSNQQFLNQYKIIFSTISILKNILVCIAFFIDENKQIDDLTSLRSSFASNKS